MNYNIYDGIGRLGSANKKTTVDDEKMDKPRGIAGYIFCGTQQFNSLKCIKMLKG